VAIGKSNTSSEHVTQNVIVLPSYETKKLWMKEMLPILAEIGRLIIFVSSRVDCEQIAQEMRNSPDIGGKGYVIGSLHGDKHQSDRNSTLAAFRKGTMTALVATDVASRGLDVTDVMTVINFDVAKNLDAHIHRIGRCGRLSVNSDSATQEQKKGNAYTILTPSDCSFANILLESFLREGREVSNELMELASKSKHFGGGGRHQSWNKTGLGYDDSDTYTGDGGHQTRASSYYGPSSQPVSKRPRLTDSKYS
jgi:ATP-dependent RNA helicase DDX42